MRDTLRTKEHWDNMLNYITEELEWSKSSTIEIIKEKGADFHGVKIGYLEQRTYYIMMINSLYSSGEPIDEIKAIFPDALETFSKSWTSESGYIDLIHFISIGIMVGAPIEMMQELERLVAENDYGDYLLDFLFNSIDPSWEKKHSNFNAPIPYEFLAAVIEAETKEDALKFLNVYLAEEWYNGHDDEFWYDSHKDKDSFYDGYWSYESGAVAKILELDDKDWEEMKYYPYDMVHYTDGK